MTDRKKSREGQMAEPTLFLDRAVANSPAFFYAVFLHYDYHTDGKNEFIRSAESIYSG